MLLDGDLGAAHGGLGLPEVGGPDLRRHTVRLILLARIYYEHYHVVY